MLRVHCLQLFYNLSDPAMEDALYELESMRRFAGLRLSERIPDETTILNFRHFLEKRVHSKEKTVWGDVGYTGIEKREEHQGRSVDWEVAVLAGRRAQLPENSLLHEVERIKASIRAKVEHPFLTIKRIFCYSKVRYRGLQKNHNRLIVLAAFTNLLCARPYLAT